MPCLTVTDRLQRLRSQPPFFRKYELWLLRRLRLDKRLRRGGEHGQLAPVQSG